MTTIVDVLARCARQCSVDEPTSWLSSTDEDCVALRDDFLVETCEDVLDRVDLPVPIADSVTITSSTVTIIDASYKSLGLTFRRLQRDPLAVYETSSTRRACVPITDDGMWTHIQQIGAYGSQRFYRLTGFDQNFGIAFYPALASGDSVTVNFITNNWMTDNATASFPFSYSPGSAFTDSNDILLLPRRLVEWGIGWRFRRRHGLPHEDVR